MSRAEEAENLTLEAMHIYLQNERNKLRFGAICRRVSYAQLYKEAGFKTFDLWLESVGEVKRSHAYHLMDLYTELEVTVPAEVIPNLALNNAEDLLKLPVSKRKNPQTLELACKTTNAKFREHLNEVQPGLHLEKLDFKGFKLQTGALYVVLQALTLAKELSGFDNEGAALEYICADWLAGQNIPSEIGREAVEKVQ